jgi:hypothetical protein
MAIEKVIDIKIQDNFVTLKKECKMFKRKLKT